MASSARASIVEAPDWLAPAPYGPASLLQDILQRRGQSELNGMRRAVSISKLKLSPTLMFVDLTRRCRFRV